MTASQYRSYKAGHRYSYIGGLATKSPARPTISRSGRSGVVVDLGGYGGKMRASVGLGPPPRGNLPTLRQQPSPAGTSRSATQSSRATTLSAARPGTSSCRTRPRTRNRSRCRCVML
ncbi:DUF1883 domain-containing protein [Williamsia sp. R60]